MQELGREPLPDEIGRRIGIPAARVHQILEMSREPFSLETPIGDGGDAHLGDFIEDPEAVVPLEAASFRMLQEQVVSVLRSLSEREKRVIQLRFGLLDGHRRTLEVVGREFGLTRERIRQIEAKALSKLRHPSRSGGSVTTSNKDYRNAGAQNPVPPGAGGNRPFDVSLGGG